jgi:adenine deaminase
MFHVEQSSEEMMSLKIKGNLVDVFSEEIYPAEITVNNNRIESIKRIREAPDWFILPGFVDSHVHIESSMLTPAEFSRLAVKFGTVAVVSDPHEIANVAGIEGINFMIRNSNTVPLKCFFGAPSCVPATNFEHAGATVDSEEVKKLVAREDIHFLSEVMNFPGVINGEPEISNKIRYTLSNSKPVDGHAPGLTGKDLIKYVSAGISTDHECISLPEAEEKIALGMKIQIREGSAAKGFEIFYPLIDRYPDSVMLCTDDIHPDDLVQGHINKMIMRGSRLGINIFNLIRAACVNPVLHYNLPVGILRTGDYADMIIVQDLKSFGIIKTFIDGIKVFENGEVLFKGENKGFFQKFRTDHILKEELKIEARDQRMKIIKVRDGELYTGTDIVVPSIVNGCVVSDTQRDILKIVVVNKYMAQKPSVGFVSGFGLKTGAIAGTIAHDSHNIIAVGVSDEEIYIAINNVIDMGGGLTVLSGPVKKDMKLEIAGLMTSLDGYQVAQNYLELDSFAKQLGCTLKSPLMSLSFMSLLVIPELKISDQGLFDVNSFSFTPLFTE